MENLIEKICYDVELIPALNGEPIHLTSKRIIKVNGLHILKCLPKFVITKKDAEVDHILNLLTYTIYKLDRETNKYYKVTEANVDVDLLFSDVEVIKYNLTIEDFENPKTFKV